MRVFWIGFVVAGLVIASQTPLAAQSTGSTEKKLESKAKQQLTSQVAADTYACPMHPDVVAAKGGKCPKCGMALEKKMQKPSTVKKEPRAHKEDAHKEKSGGCQEKCGGCEEPCEER